MQGSRRCASSEGLAHFITFSSPQGFTSLRSVFLEGGVLKQEANSLRTQGLAHFITFRSLILKGGAKTK
jgi:hypothetical protein